MQVKSKHLSGKTATNTLLRKYTPYLYLMIMHPTLCTKYFHPSLCGWVTVDFKDVLWKGNHLPLPDLLQDAFV